MSAKPSFFVALLLSASFLYGQTEARDFARLRAQASEGQWASVILSSQIFLQRWPASAQADDAEYLGAVARVETGAATEALAVLRRFPRTYPQSPYNARLSYWIARSQYLLRQWDDAVRSLERQLADEPDGSLSGPSWILLGDVHEKQGNYARAERAYARASEILPWEKKGQEALLGRSRMLRLLGKSPDARLVLASVTQHSRQISWDYRLEFARVLRGLEDWNAAESAYRFLLAAENPHNATAAIELFEIFSLRQEPSKAVALFSVLPSSYLSNPNVQNVLGQHAARTGETSLARDWWEKALSQTADIKEAQLAAWNLSTIEPQGSDRILVLLQKVEEGPDPSLARESRWRRSFLLPATQQKELLLQIVSEEDDTAKQILAYQRLANVARLSDDKDTLILALNGLLEKDGEGPIDTYYYLRAEARPDRDQDLVLMDLQALLRERPNSVLKPQALYLLGSIYSDRSEFLRAEGFFHQASQAARGELRERALLARGIALMNGGRENIGHDVLRRLETEHPQSVHLGQALLVRAQTLGRSGNTRESEQLFLRLQRDFTDYRSEASLELGKIKVAEKDFQSASDWFGKVLENSQAEKSLRYQALEGRTGSLLYSGQMNALSAIFSHPLWRDSPQTRERYEYWNILASAARGDAEAVLPRTLSYVGNSFEKAPVYLEMEALPNLALSSRLRVLEELVYRFPATEAGYQGALRRASLLADTGQTQLLLTEIQRWVQNWGQDPSRGNGARILVRLVDNLRDLDAVFERTTPSIRAEYLLRRSRQLAEANMEESSRQLQIVFQTRTTRPQKEEAALLMGEAALRRQNYAEALRLFRDVSLSEIPELKAGAFLGLGLLTAGDGQIAESLQHFGKSADQGPWDASARALYEGWQLLMKSGRTREANEWEGRLRREFPNTLWTRQLDSSRI